MENIAETIQLCELRIMYTFKNKLLLCEALQNCGYAINWHGTNTTVPRNTRLAVYGDIALNMALCSLWYRKKLGTGAMTPCP